jgi:RNA polymerase sigma factor (sigma-70 family)
MKANGEVESFLAGSSGAHERVRSAVERVVRSFHAVLRTGWEPELVQETLGRVFLGLVLGRFRGAASLKTYAENVARHVCLEHARRLRRRRELTGDELATESSGPGPEESLLRAEEHRRNLRGFAALPADCRELFALLFVEGLSYAEIARRAGVTESAIRSRVHRCRLAASLAERRAATASRRRASAGDRSPLGRPAS